ncbi:MAG: hypothetical protein QGG36_15865 [Pirellulaceae bacterium]|jgi:hypothetical protein|nr:hypothetical protein [Pirellulaceae bacterium]MDP7017281.1 hypothetical protein [Pirellulaceae bacterium]
MLLLTKTTLASPARKFRGLIPLMMVAVLFAATGALAACPFCAAVSQTFSEEIDTMDTVVVAQLVKLPPKPKPGDDSAPKATFRISTVIKGGEHVPKSKLIQTIYFGRAKLNSSFLVMGVDPPQVMWSTPLPMSKRGLAYVSKLKTLPQEGAARLAFFQDYLEDSDEMLARDAYDEFAKAPYESVIALKSKMDHDQLVAWIKDQNVPASRRRLYLTMLGVCGGKNDLPFLESLLRSKDRRAKAGLDALIACYLTLKGPDGLGLVEDLYLKNKKADYADTYAAIMAVRFHGNSAEIIPRQRLVKALHHMLERPQLADLVIPDLARWDDWSQIDRLVKLFKEADEKSSWVKVPVINYLRACPKPEAAEIIKELEKLDPAAVKRANTFFPYKPAKDDTKSNAEKVKAS